MMGSVKSYLNYADRKSGYPTLNPGEINHKTLKPQSKYETERLVDIVIDDDIDASQVMTGRWTVNCNIISNVSLTKLIHMILVAKVGPENIDEN